MSLSKRKENKVMKNKYGDIQSVQKFKYFLTKIITPINNEKLAMVKKTWKLVTVLSLWQNVSTTDQKSVIGDQKSIL